MQDLVWLAGLIDGDGCICVSKERRKEMGGALRLIALVEVSATIPAITNKVMEILNSMHIEFNYCLQKTKRKPIHRVRLQNLLNIEKLLLWVHPYLVGKKEASFWMLEFTKQRRLEGQKYSDLSIAIAGKVNSLAARTNVERG